MVIKIVSSGQSGVDRAALDVAMENDIACGGWCAKGRLMDDGPLDAKYPLVETDSPSPARRTEANVRDSDGTLILTWGQMDSATIKTAAIASRLKRPVFVVNMSEAPKIDAIETWVTHYQVRVLNIAGPKASEVPQAYEEARAFLKTLLVGDEVPEDEPAPETP